MRCPKCGAPLRRTDKFCSQCGTPASFRETPEVRDSIFAPGEEEALPKRTKGETPLYDEHLYHDRFMDEPEEGSHAMLVTLTILLFVAVLAAGFLLLHFFMNQNGPFAVRAPQQITELAGTEVSADAGDIVILDADGGAEADATVQADATAQADAAAQAAASDAAQPQTQAAPVTEKPTEKQTEKPTEAKKESIDSAKIDEILGGSGANAFGAAIFDINGNKEYTSTGSDTPMYASATISVPILYTAAVLLDQGAITLNDQITYVNSIGGRGEGNYGEKDGKPFPLSYYLTTMLTYSDNNCMNCLIDYLTLDRINTTCNAAGFASVKLERKIVEDVTDGSENYISTSDLTMMVKELYNGKYGVIGRDFLTMYFKVNEGDESRTVIGDAPNLPQDVLFLNQNGKGDTRYAETAVIADGSCSYVISVMLTGEYGFSFQDAVGALSDYVYQSLSKQEDNS